jgi:hypothetical protein
MDIHLKEYFICLKFLLEPMKARGLGVSFMNMAAVHELLKSDYTVCYFIGMAMPVSY